MLWELGSSSSANTNSTWSPNAATMSLHCSDTFGRMRGSNAMGEVLRAPSVAEATELVDSGALLELRRCRGNSHGLFLGLF